MTELATLIADLEQAEGPSRELDFAIAKTVFPGNSPDTTKHSPPINFTSLVDLALELVPEGWGWAVAELDEGIPSAVTTNREPQIIPGTLEANPKKIDFRIKAATPAMALVIASLKARAATAEGA